MKYETIHHQRTVETTDPATFDRLFEEAIKELAGEDVEIVRNMNRGTHCIYLTWVEKITHPEDLREEYECRGDARTCGECTELETDEDGRRKYYRCPVRTRTQKESSACLRYYRRLEEGEK